MEGFLSAPVNAVPPPAAHLVSCAERDVGLGGRRGTATSADFAVVALKGLQLDAVVRFRLWGTDHEAVDAAVRRLQEAVTAAARDPRLPAMDVADLATAAPVELPTGIFWFSTVDYRVLFEYRFEDADGAEGLIAVIPVDLDPERAGSPEREHLMVSDAMARWDNAAAADVRVGTGAGLAQVGAVSVLSALPPGFTGAPVVLEVRSSGTARRQLYPTVRAFTDAAAADTTDGPVSIGGVTYRPGRLDLATVLPPGPVPLTRPGDAVTVSYAAPALDDPAAVLYLRLRS
jgi:hypothetical protein